MNVRHIYIRVARADRQAVHRRICRILGPDQEGEVVRRGPTEMLGYLDDDAATAEIRKFDWLHTGDIGRRDADGS